MKIVLAGYNIDIDSLKEYGRRTVPLTPETISAAYARISRSPKSVTALRGEARHAVEQARKSNRAIIFEMGHHSIAEHAVFNFDIIGISRLCVEVLEAYRLCSYTEKSQRYVTLRGDHVIPKELKDKRLKRQYIYTIKTQNALYKKLYEKISRHNIEGHTQDFITHQEKRSLQNLAKEDARYILALATQTQLGATINARNLELMIRRFATHPLDEVRELGKKMYKTVKKITPSIILFCNPSEYDKHTYLNIKRQTTGILHASTCHGKETDVALVDHTHSGDDRILAALLFKSSQRSYMQCWRAVRKMSKMRKKALFKKACQHVELYDVLLREFEYAHVTYSLTVSAACFGQLKRHRIATLSSQEYNPSLGIVVPESVKKVGEGESFRNTIDITEKLYDRLLQKQANIAPYVLTNAHRKNVLIRCNLRELYHISRLREDPTAQWDIRTKVHIMTKLAKRVMPITTQLIGGKHEYPALYRRLYGKMPRVTTTPKP